jgi:inorganic pyrophosphatase
MTCVKLLNNNSTKRIQSMTLNELKHILKNHQPTWNHIGIFCFGFLVMADCNNSVSKLTLEIDERDLDMDSIMDIVRTQEQILETLEQILEVLNKTSASE